MRLSVCTLTMFCPFIVSAFASTIEPEEMGGINLSLASKYFQEFASVCEKDGGALWGTSLEGPVVFVDMVLRTVAANQTDAEGRLAQHEDVFVGKIPDDVLVANTSVEWAGVRWAMVIWQFIPDDKEARTRLMTHEAFHRVQGEIGFPMTSAQNTHLDTLDGRLWLQLEWRSLENALRSDGQERRDAIEDALIFRAYRRSLFPESAQRERTLEMHEGLAEYTAVKLSGISKWKLVGDIQKAPTKYQTFSQSFAYVSAPAYGLLLDESSASWREGLKPEDDLGVLLGRTIDFSLPPDLQEEAERRSVDYDGTALRAAEEERERKRQEKIAAYRARLVGGPVLILLVPHGMQCTSNVNKTLHISEHETVYATCKVKAEWGIITVSSGGLLRDWERKAVYVTAPSDPGTRPLQGDGWTLELNEGWRIKPSERRGDYVLIEEDR